MSSIRYIIYSYQTFYKMCPEHGSYLVFHIQNFENIFWSNEQSVMWFREIWGQGEICSDVLYYKSQLMFVTKSSKYPDKKTWLGRIPTRSLLV